MAATLETPPIGQEVFWTAEDFLDRLEPVRRADLIEDEKCRHEPASLSHAHLIDFLDELRRRWLRQSGTGGEPYREVVAVKVGQRNVFLPDLCWFDKTQSARLPATHAPIPPRRVCEVLGPLTAHRDEGPEFAAGEQITPSAELPGFAVRRVRLNPASLPDAHACLAEISAPPA